MSSRLSFLLLLLAFYSTSSYASQAVVAENAPACAVQASLSYPDTIREAGEKLKSKTVALVQETYEEFETCHLPKYVAQSCHTSYVQGVRRGGCYLDMMFLCEGSSKAPPKCKAMDSSILIGTKIKAEKKYKAVISDLVIGKGIIEEDFI